MESSNVDEARDKTRERALKMGVTFQRIADTIGRTRSAVSQFMRGNEAEFVNRKKMLKDINAALDEIEKERQPLHD